MSVLIKGMKMPTSCLRGGCPIEGGSCSLWEDEYWKSPDEPYHMRHPKCPLVEVPTPHGRLIDADALCAGKLSNDNVVIYAKTAPTIIEAEEGAEE